MRGQCRPRLDAAKAASDLGLHCHSSSCFTDTSTGMTMNLCSLGQILKEI